MSIDLNDPKMDGYSPLENFRSGDHDHSSRIRDMGNERYPQKLVIAPASVDFGEVALPLGSYPQTVTLTNSGYEAVTIDAVAVVGAFELVGDTPVTVAPGETAALQVRFKPTRLGSSTGGLYIDTGDAAGQEFVELRGDGVNGLPANALPDHANDAAAAAGGVPVNGWYRTGSTVKTRIS